MVNPFLAKYWVWGYVQAYFLFLAFFPISYIVFITKSITTGCFPNFAFPLPLAFVFFCFLLASFSLAFLFLSSFLSVASFLCSNYLNNCAYSSIFFFKAAFYCLSLVLRFLCFIISIEICCGFSSLNSSSATF